MDKETKEIKINYEARCELLQEQYDNLSREYNNIKKELETFIKYFTIATNNNENLLLQIDMLNKKTLKYDGVNNQIYHILFDGESSVRMNKDTEKKLKRLLFQS